MGMCPANFCPLCCRSLHLQVVSLHSSYLHPFIHNILNGCLGQLRAGHHTALMYSIECEMHPEPVQPSLL